MDVGDENRDPNLDHHDASNGGAEITSKRTAANSNTEEASKSKAAKLEHPESCVKKYVALTFEVVEYGVRFQLSVNDTVFGLMNTVCEYWLDKRRHCDGDVYAHLWTISDRKSNRHYYGPHQLGSEKHETAEHSTPLNELMNPDGTFPVLSVVYDMGNTDVFELEMVKKSGVAAKTYAKLPRVLPKKREPVDAPILTAEEIVASEAYRTRVSEAQETEYSPAQECVIKANPHPWRFGEKQAISCLIKAGMGFSKAWNQYLQHTLLFRTKGSASNMYYQMKKYYEKSNDASAREERLRDARRVLRSVRKQCLETPLRFAKYRNEEEYVAALRSGRLVRDSPPSFL